MIRSMIKQNSGWKNKLPSYRCIHVKLYRTKSNIAYVLISPTQSSGMNWQEEAVWIEYKVISNDVIQTIQMICIIVWILLKWKWELDDIGI